MKNNLAQLLCDRQFLSSEQASDYIEQADRANCSFEALLIDRKIYSRNQLLQIMENHYFTPSINLEETEIDIETARRLPQLLAQRYEALLTSEVGGTARVAFTNPDNDEGRTAIEQSLRCKVVPLVTLQHDLQGKQLDIYGLPEQKKATTKGSKKPKAITAEDQSASTLMLSRSLKITSADPIQIVDTIIYTAAQLGVTDIHFQPAEEAMMLRFRFDGIMHTVKQFPREMTKALTSRIKVMADLDIAEHRLPQDGRYSVKTDKAILDLRISVLPSQFGEKIVIRVLAKDMNLLNLDNLNLPTNIERPLQDALHSPQGFYLVTGPTGSGKTTTLYAILNGIDREVSNVITLEDPIEYSLNGLTQVQIHDDIGMSFASGLRSILRQDPDVVLVGEIRDKETVEIACRAALTGHKVFSTLHTNDSCQSVSRLIDMGVAPYLISATLRGVIAQRLVRLNCTHCLEQYEVGEEERELLGQPKLKHLSHGAGCDHCHGTGYRGRQAIFEYFEVNQSIQRLINEKASPYAIRQAAIANGLMMISEMAKEAVVEGRTTVAEIQRALMTHDDNVQHSCPHCLAPTEKEWTHCAYCGGELG